MGSKRKVSGGDLEVVCKTYFLFYISESKTIMSGWFCLSSPHYVLDKLVFLLAAGVPCVPGYHGDNQDPNYLYKQAELIGIVLPLVEFHHDIDSIHRVPSIN